VKNQIDRPKNDRPSSPANLSQRGFNMPERGPRARWRNSSSPQRRSIEADPQHVEDGPANAQTEGESPCLQILRFMADSCPTFYETLEHRFGGDTGRLCDWLTSPNDHLEGNTPSQMITHARLDLVNMAMDEDFPLRN